MLIISLCGLYEVCGRKHDAGKLHTAVYIFTWLQITKFTEQRSSASQDVPRCLLMLKGHYRVHNSPTLVHVLRHTNPVNALPLYLRSILIFSFHQSTTTSFNWSLSFGFSSKILHEFPSPLRVTCPVHLIRSDLITRTISCEEYQSWISSSLNVCPFFFNLFPVRLSSSLAPCSGTASAYVLTRLLFNCQRPCAVHLP